MSEVYLYGIRLEHVSELNTWDVFWMNQVQVKECVVGRWRMGGGLQVLLDLWLVL